MTMESTQLLTKLVPAIFPRRLRRPVCRAYKLHMPNVLKSGSLKLLENSGPIQACNGIAL